MQAMTLNEAAQDLWSVIDAVNDNHEPLVVTDEHHKPIVIMSLDDFNAWQETSYLTRSSANAKDLLEAVEEINMRKNLTSHELVETL
ncbi:type II toxin-antitoxin system Phd/YefM family antitoxin [Candidatus Marithrix sp. Canyon 246]|uniref:type II toxin-antitoxin system Phd/YefM family antitoxin n=1 Tax=Candidatus Marithrix sp. Canyon 246 TaxID=1827136 RepID=UPI000849EFBC|nr:type II toxin-antitoxin system prevent-host-death family antitoxin [Candidatus Marithrix sp. Canyon 246]